MAAPGTGLSIGEAATLVGVSPSTLRLWEQQGLTTSRRTPAGHRRFDAADIERLRTVRTLRATAGMPLAHIRAQLPEPPAGSAPTVDASHPGAQIHLLREARGLSLRELARRAGVAASHVSAVERGVVHPSVALLQRLTRALETTVGAMRTPSAAAGALVRRGEAASLGLAMAGVRIEDLGPAARHLEPQLFIIDPGAHSGGDYRHEGEEFLYVLDGRLEIIIGGAEHYAVEAGDSLCFESTRIHRWRNPGTAAARLLWVNTPPTF